MTTAARRPRPAHGIAAGIAIAATVAAAYGITHPAPAAPAIDTTAADSCPAAFHIDDTTTDAAMADRMAAGWIGDPADDVEALYAPGCIPGGVTITTAVATDGTITRNYVRPDGTVYGNVTGPDGDVVAVFGIDD